MADFMTYGNLPYSAKTSIQYDRIFKTKTEMMQSLENEDENNRVYIGRYVLVSAGDIDIEDLPTENEEYLSDRRKNYDGTLWQKIVQNGQETYVLVCDLNGTPPDVILTASNPSLNKNPEIKITYQDRAVIKVNATKPWRVNSHGISVNTSTATGDKITLTGTNGVLSGSLELKSVKDATDNANSAASEATQAADAYKNAEAKISSATKLLEGVSNLTSNAPVFVSVSGDTKTLTTGTFDYQPITTKVDSLDSIAIAANNIPEEGKTISNYQAVKSSNTSNKVILEHGNDLVKYTKADKETLVAKDSYYNETTEQQQIAEDFIDYEVFIPIIDTCGHVVGKQKQIVKIPDVQSILKKYIGNSALYQTNAENGRIISTLEDAFYWREHLNEYQKFCQDAFETIIFKISNSNGIYYSSNSVDDVKTSGLILADADETVYKSTNFGGGESTSTVGFSNKKGILKYYPIDNIANGTYYNDIVRISNQILDELSELTIYYIPKSEDYILVAPFSNFIPTSQRFRVYDSTLTREALEQILIDNQALLDELKTYFVSESTPFYLMRERRDGDTTTGETYFVFEKFSANAFKKGTNTYWELGQDYSVNYKGFGSVN